MRLWLRSNSVRAVRAPVKRASAMVYELRVRGRVTGAVHAR